MLAKKSTFALLVIIILFFAVIFVHSVLPWILLIGPAPSHSRIERDFQRDREQLIIVRDFLIESEIGDIHINSDSAVDWLFSEMEQGRISTEHETALEIIHQFSQRRSGVISRRDNVIIFQRWSSLDAGRGIAYSIDGSVPDNSTITFLVQIEPLSEEGWFFYIDDFSEYRMRYA